jgi:hypothetical protein
MPRGHSALARRCGRTPRRPTAAVGRSATAPPFAAAFAVIGTVGHDPATARTRGRAPPTPGRMPPGTVGRAHARTSTRGRARPPPGWVLSWPRIASAPGGDVAHPLAERADTQGSAPAPGRGVAHPPGGRTSSIYLADLPAPAVVSPGRTLTWMGRGDGAFTLATPATGSDRRPSRVPADRWIVGPGRGLANSASPAPAPSWTVPIAGHRGGSSQCGSGRRQALGATSGLRPATHCGVRPRGRGGASRPLSPLGHQQARRSSSAPPLRSRARAGRPSHLQRTHPRGRRWGLRWRPHKAVARSPRLQPLPPHGTRRRWKRPRGGRRVRRARPRGGSRRGWRHRRGRRHRRRRGRRPRPLRRAPAPSSLGSGASLGRHPWRTRGSRSASGRSSSVDRTS